MLDDAKATVGTASLDEMGQRFAVAWRAAEVGAEDQRNTINADIETVIGTKLLE